MGNKKAKQALAGFLSGAMVLTAAPVPLANLYPAYVMAAETQDEEQSEAALVQVDSRILQRYASANCEQKPTKSNDGTAAWAFNGKSGNWWHSRWDDSNMPSGTMTKAQGQAALGLYNDETGLDQNAEYLYIGSGFGKVKKLKKIIYKGRSDQKSNHKHWIQKYALQVSDDGVNYRYVPVAADGSLTGSFDYAANADQGEIELPEAVSAKYFRICVLTASDNYATASEIQVYCEEEKLTPQLKLTDLNGTVSYAKEEHSAAMDGAENPATLDVTASEVEEDAEAGIAFSGKITAKNGESNNEKFDISGETPLLITFDFYSDKISATQTILGKTDEQYGIQLDTNQMSIYCKDSGGSWPNAYYTFDDSFWGKWHHVTAVYTGSAFQIFVDGKAGNTQYASVNGLVSRGQDFAIGYNVQKDTRDFKGKAANVKLYSGDQVPQITIQEDSEYDYSSDIQNALKDKTPFFDLQTRPAYLIEKTTWQDDGTDVTVSAQLKADSGYCFDADNEIKLDFLGTEKTLTGGTIDPESGVMTVTYTLSAEEAKAYRDLTGGSIEEEIKTALAEMSEKLNAVTVSPKFPQETLDSLKEKIAAFEETVKDKTSTEKKEELENLQAAVADFLKGKKVPVLKVSFDDETANDSSGFGNNGTIIGTPEFVDGVSGKALHLVNPEDRSNPATQYVNFGQPEELKNVDGDLTVTLWYKSDLSVTKEGAIFGNKDWASGDNAGFMMADMKEGVYWNYNTANSKAAGKKRVEIGRYPAATDGQWHLLTGIIDQEKQEIRFYIDNNLAGSKTKSGWNGAVDTFDWVLGADGVLKRGNGDGYFDELQVYKDVLTEEEIEGLVFAKTCDEDIAKIENRVNKAEAGARFTQENIDAMKAEVQQKKAQIKAAATVSEKKETFDALEADYEEFLLGNKADLSFHIVSDIHLTAEGTANRENFKQGLQNMKEINPDADVFISCGDNTQDGTEVQENDFYQLIKDNNPVSDGKVLVTMGNHDVRGPQSSNWEDVPTGINAWWNNAYTWYMRNNADFMPSDTNGKTYFDYWINGYHFIVLNEENSPKDSASVTDEQIEWLDKKLSENENADRPVFVIIHQSLEETHQHGSMYNGFGTKDAAMKEVLSRHPETVMLTGHIHNGFGTMEVIDRPYGTMVDIPSFKQPNSGWGLPVAGSGYEVYVYEDEMVFRAVNFLTKEWLPEYDYSVKVTTLPVLASEANALRAKDYTTESWSAAESELKDALAQAKKLMNKKYSVSVANSGVTNDFLYHEDTRDEIITVQKKLSAAMALLKERGDSEGELQKEIADFQKRVEQLNTDLTKANQDLEKANADITAAQQKLAAAQQELATAQQNLADVNEELHTAKQNVTKAELAKAKADEERDAAIADKNTAESEKAAAEAKAKTAEDNLKKAQADLASAQQKQQEAETAKSTAEAAKTKAEQEKAAAETAKAEAIAAKETAETKLAAAEAAKEKAEKEAQDAKDAAEEAAKKEQEAKDAADAAAKREQAEKAAAAEAAKKAADAESKNKELQSKLDDANKQLADNNSTKVARMTKPAVKAGRKKSLKVTWKKLANVKGYEIQYATNKKFKGAKVKTVSAKKSSVVLKNLKKGKKYYVRVRAYKMLDDNEIRGAYSAAGSRKVK